MSNYKNMTQKATATFVISVAMIVLAAGIFFGAKLYQANRAEAYAASEEALTLAAREHARFYYEGYYDSCIMILGESQESACNDMTSNAVQNETYEQTRDRTNPWSPPP